MSIERIFLWLFGTAIFFTILYFVIYNAVKDAILSAAEQKENNCAQDKAEESQSKAKSQNSDK
ncbi:MAG TPA: hypothetical protein VHT34_13650 [Clostridia bacterium]|nr:hypothetical protein [Clostridia bacterium]